MRKLELRYLTSVAGMLALTALANTASAEPPLSTRVTPSDGESGDHFGFAVAVRGNTAVVGAPGDGDAGALSGSAYVYVWQNEAWVLQAKLVAADSSPNASFGQSVDVDGDTIVVGAPYANATNGAQSGAAYVFARSGTSWTQQAKLSPADGTALDFFGSVISLSGNIVLAGAPYADVFGADSGAAYLYGKSGTVWSQISQIAPNDGRSNDLFGSAVSLRGTTAAIGAPNDDDNAIASGSAYIYARLGSNWLIEQKLRPTDGANGDLFSNALSLDGDNVLIGAPERDDQGLAVGAAYVFSRSSGVWAQRAQLHAVDGLPGDFFGAAVALSSGVALVSSFLNDEGAEDAGAVYAYARTAAGGWQNHSKYRVADPAAEDSFGAAVALDGGLAVIGADQRDDRAPNAGAMFPKLVSAPADVPASGNGSLVPLFALALLGVGLRRSRGLRWAQVR